MAWKCDSEEAVALVGVWDMSGESRRADYVCYGEDDLRTDEGAGQVVNAASSGSVPQDKPQDVGDRRMVVRIGAKIDAWTLRCQSRDVEARITWPFAFDHAPSRGKEHLSLA